MKRLSINQHQQVCMENCTSRTHWAFHCLSHARNGQLKDTCVSKKILWLSGYRKRDNPVWGRVGLCHHPEGFTSSSRKGLIITPKRSQHHPERVSSSSRRGLIVIIPQGSHHNIKRVSSHHHHDRITSSSRKFNITISFTRNICILPRGSHHHHTTESRHHSKG